MPSKSQLKPIGQAGIFAGLLLFCFVSSAHATLIWKPAPKKPGQSHSRMAPKPFVLNGAADTVMLWKPDLAVMGLAKDTTKVLLKPTGMNNYHALVAERRSDANTLEAAMRYVYLNGKPSGNSPSLLTTAVKTPLEIVPAPLPREHRRYLANHDAVFVLRYEGKPVTNTKLQVSTSNGSQWKVKTDRIGAVRITLPDDFVEVKPGRRNNRPAEFVLQAEVAPNAQLFRTSLSAQYHVDPAHWQSFELGLSVLAAGFVAGVFVNRRSLRAQDNRGRKV
jgi:hypothetical protein